VGSTCDFDTEQAQQADGADRPLLTHHQPASPNAAAHRLVVRQRRDGQTSNERRFEERRGSDDGDEQQPTSAGRKELSRRRSRGRILEDTGGWSRSSSQRESAWEISLSYTSTTTFPPAAKLSRVVELVELLGYRKYRDDLKVPNCVGCYFWFERLDYQSHTGVELYLYRDDQGTIAASTRSRTGRSYWDLSQQNRTLRLFRGLLGGAFTTDAGSNRYWHPGEKTTPLGSGCYIARWRHKNAAGRAESYIQFRGLKVPIASKEPTGVWYIDEMNPLLLSNNLVLPYVVAVWEEYFKATFVAILRYSPHRDAALKRVRLNQAQLELVATGAQVVEEAVAETMSFQRPSIIKENFRLLDPKLDLGGVLKKPYKRRKQSLFESIEERIEHRNEFVHAGTMDLGFTEARLVSAIQDFDAAVNRVYEHLGAHYKFPAKYDF